MSDTASFQPHAPIAALGVESRATFITQTYVHLFAAILGFVGVEIVLFSTGMAEVLAQKMLGVNWLLVLGAFMVVGWFATRTAHRTESLPAQYLALTVFVVAEAVIFVPLLYIANFYAPGAIESAALITLMGFGTLTAVVFVTRKDFSFLGALLRWGFLIALVLIVAGVIFGFQLGTFFSVAMIALAGGSVLYDTSKILHHYPQDRYVGAALELFASVALMFWYVLRLLMSRR